MNQTALHPQHLAAGARMVEFAGWSMPLLYRGIVEEHLHTRAAASVFDVSHMGRLELRGTGAETALQRACTRNVAKLAVGRCGYSHVCNEQGGILDDVIVARFEEHWLVVCNASNRPTIAAHLEALCNAGGASLTDRTADTCMIAVQGPKAFELLGPDVPITLPIDPASLKRYAFLSGVAFGLSYSLFRTGYTGEDGFEIIAPAAAGPLIWKFVTESEARGGVAVRPAGLGARDTLRLEAGMPLYGHELGTWIDPLSAGCGWCVDLAKDFIGVAALRAVQQRGPKRKLVGLRLEGRRIARQGAAVLHGESPVGEVTSGTQSPTLGCSIAMAYVEAGHATEGTAVQVDLRGERAPARIVPLPFYKRPAP